MRKLGKLIISLRSRDEVFFQKKVECAKWQAAFELLESYCLFDKVLDVFI